MYDGDLPTHAQGLALGLIGVVPFVPRGGRRSGAEPPFGPPSGVPAGPPEAVAIPDATMAAASFGEASLEFPEMMLMAWVFVLGSVLLTAVVARARR